MTVALAAAAVLLAAYAWYVALITRRNKVREAMASVDVHLTQRHDLLPNIVALAGQYMQHERALLADVTRLRASAQQAAGPAAADVARRFQAEDQLGQRVGQIFARLEAYPELKAVGPIVQAQQTWVEVEAQITAARRFYNAAVNRLNNAVQMFPGSLIAAAAGVQAMPFFAAAPGAREAPAVGDRAERRP